MNSFLKWILVVINVVMLYLAYKWYKQKEELEPLIVICGQAATLIGLLLEKQVSNIITNRITNSGIGVDAVSGDNVETKNVKDSTVNIKTRK